MKSVISPKSLALGTFCALALWPQPVRGSIAYGSINNFDTVNDTGVETHGFEIDIEDCVSTAVTYTYDYNHYGTSHITQDDTVPGHPKCIVRWESKKNPDGTWAAYTAIPAAPIPPTQGHQFTNPAVNFGGEHFGVGYNVAVGAVSYNWLVDNGAGELVKGGSVQVSTPIFTYYPPVAAAPPQVQAVIVPPPPPAPPPKEFGPAVWVKEIRTTAHNNHEVKLRDLVSADPADPNGKNWKNGEADEVEVEWRILQTSSLKPDGGPKNKLAAAAEALPNGDEMVTRRYEFYKYTGPLDAETGEAMGDVVGSDGIHGSGSVTYADHFDGALGEWVTITTDMSTVAVVGDFTGAQMAAAGVAAPLALIDHVSEGRVNTAYAGRTLVIEGSQPAVTTFAGALPAGMAFDNVTGVLDGTPTVSGEFQFKITSTDGANPDVSKNYTLLIAAAGAALPPQSMLDTAAAPAGSGTTTGDGAFAPGSNVTVNATAGAGFHFVNWTDNAKVVSASPGYTFAIDVNHSLVANFAANLPQRAITTDSSPLVGGMTSGGGAVDDGSLVTVVATPALGYIFAAWTEGGAQVSSDASYAFTATTDRTLVANFTPAPTYAIATSATPTAGGTTTGGGSYSSGSGATVTASANAGYVFMRWTVSGTQVSTSPSYAFSVTANKTLVANFVLAGAQMTISTSASPVAGGGTSGGGIYAAGNSATVIATANPGYVFSKWQSGTTTVSLLPSYTFTVTSSQTLAAKFTEAFVITAGSSPATGGTTEMDSKHYKTGETATALATPAAGFTFANWTENGVIVSTGTSYSFKVTGNRVLVANFRSNTGLTVNANAATAAGGTITGDGVYQINDPVTVTAVPNAGYGFVSWTENGMIVSNDPTFAFAADTNHALVAHFATAVLVSASASPAPQGAADGGGSYGIGAVATLLATPNPGYLFANWSEGGIVVSDSASYSFTVTTARTLVANFMPPFTIGATVAAGGGGTITGTGSYGNGANVDLTAWPDPGYQFVNWTENGSVVSISASYSFIAGGNRSLAANFALIIPQLSATVAVPGTMTLEWPADLPGWILEESADLTPGGWIDSAKPVTPVNGMNQVQVDTAGGALFLRLRHP